MPGITGLISSKQGEDVFNAMIKSLNHNNYKVDKWSKNNINLARIHLGYVNKSVQPVFSKDKRYGLILTGEVFSYGDIENESNDDSGFLLNIFLKDGEQAFQEIDGQYAACIYDFVEDKLFLISDRFGTRPLYYYYEENNFLFAPEVKAILKTKLNTRIDYSSISDLFHFGHLFGNKTLFNNIKQLPPASYLIYRMGKIEIKNYWDFPEYAEAYEKIKFSRNEINNYIEEMQEIYAKAMKRQIFRNSSKLLIPLSGGLDSRYVIAYASALKTNPLVTFTFGPENNEDQVYAKMVAREVDAQHKSFIVQPGNIWEDAKYFSFVSDGMSMINGPIQILPSLRDFSVRKEILIAAQMCDVLFGSTLERRRIKYLIGRDHFDGKSKGIITNIFNLFQPDILQSIFDKSFLEKIDKQYKEIPLSYIEKYKRPLHSYFNLIMNEHGRRGTLGGNLLINTLYETRMPSYDNELVEFAYKLPVELKKKQFLYRKAFINKFPDLAAIKREGVNLPISASNIRLELKSYENKLIPYLKSTSASKVISKFSRWNKPSYVSYNEWFKNDLKQEMEAIILDKKTLSRGLYNENGLKGMLRQHSLPGVDHSRLIWQIINLEYFFRNFID